jgi:hypothetical protein
MVIQVNHRRYKIRGPWTPKEIRSHWKAFQTKYPNSVLTFEQWLVGYGKVYFQLPGKGQGR